MDDRELRRLRRGITPKLRNFILGDGGADCHYCGFTATEIDHVVPVSRGGGVALSNLVPACHECNAQKSDQTVDEWAQSRRDAGKPWPIPNFHIRVSNVLESGAVPPMSDGEKFSEWLERIGGYPLLRRLIVAERDRELATIGGGTGG